MKAKDNKPAKIMTVVVRTIGGLHYLLEEKKHKDMTVHKDLRMCFLPAQEELAHRVAWRLEHGQPAFARPQQRKDNKQEQAEERAA